MDRGAQKGETGWRGWLGQRWCLSLFPGSRAAAQAPPSGGTIALGLALVLVVAGTLFFARLRSPLLEPDEARYAEIPRQMLVEHRLLVPVLHGQPYYHKPPLLYWLIMASYGVFGVHDWAARLVPCTAAWLTVLVSFYWCGRAAGWRAAFIGAGMLCLSARFVYLGRMLTMDSLLALWVVAAWALAHAARQSPRLGRGCWCFSAIACALAILTKGPVALVLVVVPLVLHQILEQRLARVSPRAWLLYFGLALGLSGPWYAALCARAPDFAETFFWRHNLLRYIAPLDHQEPAWYYLPGLLLGMLPWSLLLWPLGKSFARRSAVVASRRPPAMGFFLLSALWCLLFFSAAGCKRPGYILPALPPMALALGCYLENRLPRNLLQKRRGTTGRWHIQLAYRATLLVLGAGLAGSLLAVSARLQRPAEAIAIAIGATVALGFMLRQGPSRRVGVAWGTCSVATFAGLLLALHQVWPAYSRKFSLRAQVMPQRTLAANPAMPVICYPHRWDSVSFYLGRNDVRVYGPEDRDRLIAELRRHPSALLFVKTERALKDLLAKLPPSLDFVPSTRNEIVTAGQVYWRREVPSTILARR
jgi:4-amino-4-deoxy-L-arabinose transferase-like glycosyltransferase